jgi:hypothetical protein
MIVSRKGSRIKIVSILIFILVVLVIKTAGLTSSLFSNDIPPEIADSFLHPQGVTLYAIDPVPHRNSDALLGEREFHGFGILGQVPIDAAQGRAVFKDLETSALQWKSNPRRGRLACFNPRHGIRVTKDSHNFDFLICYECGQVLVYRDGKKVQSLYFDAFAQRPSPQPLNDILIAAGISVAP